MTGTWRQYTVLALLLAAAGSYQTGNIIWVKKLLAHPEEVPTAPFSIANATRTINSGPLKGDEILSLNGRPFTAIRQYDQVVRGARPGDELLLVLSEPSGRAVEKRVAIPNKSEMMKPAAMTALSLCLDVFIPILCLSLGFGVAFILPRDRNAWLLLFLLVGFAGLMSSSEWYDAFSELPFLWTAFCNSIWAVAMGLFAIYFPARFAPDRRHPWVKYLVLVPALTAQTAMWTINEIWRHDIAASQALASTWRMLSYADIAIQMVSISAFFAILGIKASTEQLPDELRRLRILRMGSFLAFTPMFPIVLYAMIRGTGLMAGIPLPLLSFALFMMALFPVTLVYVIVVERAMDLRVVLRQSVKYTLARRGLRVIRSVLLASCVFIFLSHVGGSWRPALVLCAVAALIVVRKKNMEKASVWLDRKFFREAYNAELLLSELALEVGRYTEIDPLLETVARRIDATLHVEDIVILVREGNVYRTRYSTRQGEPMDIAANSHMLSAPAAQTEPLQVFPDKPQPWMKRLDTTELQALAYMRSEVVLVLRGQGSDNNQVIGIMSLGARKSGEPYSKTDLRLLQTIAVQMGMAVHNSRLVTSLAAEAAHREVMNRELEIAREVQERLFPQKFPKVEGIDCFGFCRPARGVGGDYYDVIELRGGLLGFAIGDVSGKGIAAALLMASLQASLRGQAMAGVHDLAELMRNVNKLVFDASPGNKYATFFYGEFDPGTGQFGYVNAGHNAPVILRGDEVIHLEATGPVVGLLPGADYEMATCRLEPGDIFIGYTDGISEAMNEQDEEWEEERFLTAAKASRAKPATKVIEDIFRGADAFTGSAKQFDDMTLLVMKIAV